MSADPPSSGTAEEGTYSGVDNLEAMEAAVRYRACLTGLLSDAAGPPELKPRLLDFGAGVGTFARAARELGYDVECVELDAELGRRLRADGFAWAATVDHLADKTFHLVYTFNVLEHIEDDASALAGLLHVTEPGGRLLVYVPAFPVLFTSMDDHVGHLRRYRRGQLIRLVEGAGFEVDSCSFVDSLGFFATLTYRLSRASGKLSTRPVRIYDSLLFPVSRALDRLTHRWFGKNLVLHAHRPR